MFTKMQKELIFGNTLARSMITHVDDVLPGMIDYYGDDISVPSLNKLFEIWTDDKEIRKNKKLIENIFNEFRKKINPERKVFQERGPSASKRKV